MREWFPGRPEKSNDQCDCEPTFRGERLVVDAHDCPGGGRLATEPACRETVVDALTDADAEAIVVRRNGGERAYLDDAAALLVAAGRFVERVAFHDGSLANRALTDPLAAAHEASGRAGPVAEVAAESGLVLGAERVDGYEDALRPYVGSSISHSRVRVDPPPEGRLLDVQRIDTGSTVRRYERPGDELDAYHLEPVEVGFDEQASSTLERARGFLASGAVGGERAARRAVRMAADEDEPVEQLGRVLEKHASGLGVLVDLFGDGRVSDVFGNAPITETALYVRVDSDLAQTNVRLTERGADALASQFRLRSGRAFSRANPTLDTSTTIADRRVRVTATTEPASDGLAFAFRAHDRTAWKLRDLVGNGTLSADAAALLSTAVERAGSLLIAGPRGAGKTTLLGALLWELPTTVRTLVIEDTPELPVDAFKADGQDVQSLLATSGGPGLTPEKALRTALRLGEGALVVGEVRGEEAAVLYEAMRVGANGSAVLGTIHGSGGADVRERVVSDLDVPESSFATTDLVVTLEPTAVDGERQRRVVCIEEVLEGEDGVRFAPLFALNDGVLCPTGRIDRGNSRFIASLASSGETYSAVLSALETRERGIRDEAGTGDRETSVCTLAGDAC